MEQYNGFANFPTWSAYNWMITEDRQKWQEMARASFEKAGGDIDRAAHDLGQEIRDVIKFLEPGVIAMSGYEPDLVKQVNDLIDCEELARVFLKELP